MYFAPKIMFLDHDQDYLDGVVTVAQKEGFLVETQLLSRKNRDVLFDFLHRQKPDIIIVNLDVDEQLSFGTVINEIFYVPLPLRPLIAGMSKHGEIHFKQVAYQKGLDDFIVKPITPLEIWFRLSALIRLRTLQQQLQSSNKKLSLLNLKLTDANHQLQELTVTDDLTGLHNMRFITNYLKRQFVLLKRHPRPFAIMMIDLDHFKQVNDKNDHLVGSKTLKDIGHVIDDVMRNTDIKARYGGDEYIIAMPETEMEGALRAAERLLEGVRDYHFENGGRRVDLTASIGVGIFNPDKHLQFEDLMREADLALYAAKEGGRNQFVMFEEGKTSTKGYDSSQSAVMSELKKVA